MQRRLLVFALASLASACVAEVEPEICPAVGAGDLVVSELRGNQSGTYGEWIELYNHGAQAIDLRGLHLEVRALDGSGLVTILVRRPLTVAAGDYVVLGAFPDDQRPAHVDYGWHPDVLNSDGSIKHLPDAGALAVTACGAVVDRVVWNDLPSDGTYALGLMPPDATGNDAATAWCTDAVDDDPTAPGLPGTPGASNHPCP
ncbi:MAG: lamin tail domain-containing protein [Kofleriaceae bacterium]